MTKWFECPICSAAFSHEEDLETHVYAVHIGGSAFTDRTCFCGKSLTFNAYDQHFQTNGGVVAHYHASLLGVDPQ